MICTSCDLNKELSEFSFRKDNNKYRSECKICRSARSKKWWHDTKPMRNQKQKEHYENNRDILLSKQNEYYSNNRKRETERSRQWRENNPGKVLAANQAYYSSNRENLLEYAKDYAKKNPEIARHNRRKRKARVRSAPINDLTQDQWLDILNRFNGLCAYCGSCPDNITMDHDIPISRGGSHTASNVVPACLKCNSSKGARTATEFILWKIQRDRALLAHCQANQRKTEVI